MDPRFGPAWIAFGHTFAIEGEHDHAITAYSTSARLFQGYAYLILLDLAERFHRSHLPLLYVGMEHLCLSNLNYASEALGAAYRMCESDPLLINELGVMAYHRRESVHEILYWKRGSWRYADTRAHATFSPPP